jgi:hypothetical protein
LTIKAVPAHRLNKLVDDMFEALRKIKNRLRQRHYRGNGAKFEAIRTLECNFNPINNTYNPHFNYIVPCRSIAIALRNEWAKEWSKDKVNFWVQYIKRIDSNDKALIECIKYGTKIFTEPDPNKEPTHKTDRDIYAAAMLNILQAFKKHRIFDRVGFNKPKTMLPTTYDLTMLEDAQSWSYDPYKLDWVSDQTDEVLTGYIMPMDLEWMLEHRVDLERE